jgi:hypothetical protein
MFADIRYSGHLLDIARRTLFLFVSVYQADEYLFLSYIGFMDLSRKCQFLLKMLSQILSSLIRNLFCTFYRTSHTSR